MAAPPQYERLPPDDIESQYIAPKSTSGHSSSPLHTHQASSFNHLVTYVHENAPSASTTVLGKLGRTEHVSSPHLIGARPDSLQDTTQIARHAFPQLANCRSEELVVLVPTAGGDGWGRVMMDAWDEFERTPPSTVMIRVLAGGSGLGTTISGAASVLSMP
jgi:hypothetical protein